VRRHVEVAQARLLAGDAMRIEVVRAETEREKSHQDLLAAHLSLDNARDALATLLGRQELPLPEDPPGLAPPEEVQDLARLVSERPDVRSVHAQTAMAEQQVNAVWRQFWPSLVAGGQASYLFTDPPDLGSSDRSRWAVFLNLSVPLFNEGRYADLDQKRAQLSAATLREADVRRGAEVELRKAQRDYLAALAALANAERQVGLAREALDLTQNGYQNGVSTSLEVTDAQRSFRAAEIGAITQKLRSQMALLSLFKARGIKAQALAAPAPLK